MKIKVVTAALILGATAVLVSLFREGQSLRRALIQQGEVLASLDYLQAENAELRTRVLRWQAAEWELETLQNQVEAVPRLRVETFDLHRLRDEDRERNLRYVQLTNELHQWVETVSAMKGVDAERSDLKQAVVQEMAWEDGPEVYTGSVLAELPSQHDPIVEKRLWLGRSMLDLTGLLPTSEDMAEFLANNSDNTAEQVIDKLLTSHGHGEQDDSWLWFLRSRLGVSSR